MSIGAGWVTVSWRRKKTQEKKRLGDVFNKLKGKGEKVSRFRKINQILARGAVKIHTKEIEKAISPRGERNQPVQLIGPRRWSERQIRE